MSYDSDRITNVWMHHRSQSMGWWWWCILFVLFFLLAVSWTAVDGCFSILWYSKRYLRLAEDTPYTSNDRIKPRRLYLVAITLINKTDEEYIETETSIKFMAHSAEKINPYICICNKKQKTKKRKVSMPIIGNMTLIVSFTCLWWA